ncbi:hypothetical protein [Pantoea sp. At-9b]|uniref:hypothetical protein n=1 Tax=Pantoea sp. (strain At-9b) TaxID=592316 RepID=UPI0001B3F210|nr:hypothetical protein [Pantoea sp. At-9b]ADU70716.1 hypothetical protein Pat9b_3422 [Pantoea sp. At-9b]
MAPSQDDSANYFYILNTLDARAKKTRRNVFVLIYFLIIVVAGVVLVAYNIKNTSNSPLANAISAAIDSSDKKQLAEFVQRTFKDQFQIDTKAKRETESELDDIKNNIDKNIEKMTRNDIDNRITANWLINSQPVKSTSEKIAESIASLVISLSVFMFIGYVMRVLLIFIKYYMQLGSDYENQQMAYMMSNGEHEMFSKNLELLRAHNINLEKTPSLPQEKIITGLLDAIKNAKESMVKNKDNNK